mgnify:CR=1 FL=1
MSTKVKGRNRGNRAPPNAAALSGRDSTATHDPLKIWLKPSRSRRQKRGWQWRARG